MGAGKSRGFRFRHLGFSSHPCTVAGLRVLKPLRVPSTRWDNNTFLMGLFRSLAKECGVSPSQACSPGTVVTVVTPLPSALPTGTGLCWLHILPVLTGSQRGTQTQGCLSSQVWGGRVEGEGDREGLPFRL